MMQSPGVSRLFIWIASIMLAIAPTQLHAQPRTSEFTLANGLQVIAELNDQAHSVATGFFVKTGSRDESTDVAGRSSRI